MREPPDRLTRIAQVLNQGMDLIKAIRRRASYTPGVEDEDGEGIEPNIFEEALKQLDTLSRQEGIPIALIGGAAVIHHGYEYTTKDIDIAVSTADFHSIIRVVHDYGFTIKSWNPRGFHVLDYKGAKIEVVQEEVWDTDELGLRVPPHPAKMGITEGVEPVDLAHLALLKLSAKRRKDFTALVEVLKTKSPQEIQEAGKQLQKMSPLYYERFMALVKEAEEEQSRVPHLPEPGR
jgi:hypothetical protein